jgi:hypothetical protein
VDLGHSSLKGGAHGRRRRSSSGSNLVAHVDALHAPAALNPAIARRMMKKGELPPGYDATAHGTSVAAAAPVADLLGVGDAHAGFNGDVGVGAAPAPAPAPTPAAHAAADHADGGRVVSLGVSSLHGKVQPHRARTHHEDVHVAHATASTNPAVLRRLSKKAVRSAMMPCRLCAAVR